MLQGWTTMKTHHREMPYKRPTSAMMRLNKQHTVSIKISVCWENGTLRLLMFSWIWAIQGLQLWHAALTLSLMPPDEVKVYECWWPLPNPSDGHKCWASIYSKAIWYSKKKNIYLFFSSFIEVFASPERKCVWNVSSFKTLYTLFILYIYIYIFFLIFNCSF